MNLKEYCAMPCTGGAGFDIPKSGTCRAEELRFHIDRDRALFCAMIGNTQITRPPAPTCRVAIVGLSPADTQLRRFTEKYNRNGSYEEAASEAAFEGLQVDLVRMMNGLGVARKLGLEPLPIGLDLNECGHFLTTSLIRCASLTVSGSSSDFDPWKYDSNIKCITQRFVPEMLGHAEVEYLLVLGSKAKKALVDRIRIGSVSVHDYLVKRGKTIAYIPHPSGANRESVDLASMDRMEFPTMEQHQDRMWRKYIAKRIVSGKTRSNEASYKSTRRSRWNAINDIRQTFNA